MSANGSPQIAALRRALDEALEDQTRRPYLSSDAPRVYRDGDPLPAAAQAALDRRDPAELEQRWREATDQV